MMLALYLQTQYQQSPRLLSPGSGNISSRYSGWATTGNQTAANSINNNNKNLEDDDSGTGSTSCESHVIRYIDRNILACQICQQRYRDPKVLPCLHTFCLGCLATYLPPESLTITCPLCGQQSILPRRGIRALQSNHFLTQLIEVLSEESTGSRADDAALATDNSCTISTYDDSEDDNTAADFVYSCSCTSDLGVSPSSGSCNCNGGFCAISNQANYSSYSQTQDIIDYENNRTLYCSNHSGQSLRFYCEECETAICASCTDIEHREHHTLRMSEAVEKEKEDLRALVDQAYTQVPILKEGIRNVNDVSRNLNEKSHFIEAEINAAFDRIVQIVQTRRDKIILELQQKEASKQETLSKQRDELEGSLADLYTSCEFVEKALKHGSETEILLVKKQVGDRLVEYGQMQVVTIPAENLNLVFQPGDNATVEKSMKSWGSMFSSSAIFSQSNAIGDGVRQATVGQLATVTITARDWQGNVTAGPGVENFLCEIIPINVSHPSESPIQLTTELTDMDDGTYELNYSVPFEGQYELSIKMFGNSISGSPHKVCAVAPSEVPRSISKIQRTPTRQRTTTIKRPSSARSFMGGGSTCSRNNPIEDDLLLKVGTRGRGRGQFTNPQGVGVSQSGLIFVTDTNNQCVQCFNGQVGDCQLRFGIRGRSPGQMQRPAGVVTLQNGNIAVADHDNKCVSIYDPSGKYISRIGAGKLLGPKGLAVDKSGHLVVVDSKQSSIFVFQPSGKLVQKFGSRGSDPPKLAAPQFVAINSQGHIIVSDFHNHAIKVFNPNGELIFAFGSNGEGNGQFNAPTGVAVDSQDNIIVADWGNSRIQVFDSQGSFLSFVNTLACPLYGPQGLSITPDGHIVVADSGNHCYKIYKYLQ